MRGALQAPRELLRRLSPWAGLFSAGVLLGAVLWREVFLAVGPGVAAGLAAAGALKAAGEPALLAGIFLKNLLTASLCFLLGRPTRGAFPGLVCLLNGAVLGMLGAALARCGGIPWWRFAAALAPHGAVELPALFFACSLGLGAGPLRERAAGFGGAVLALLIAAAVEVFVSTRLAGALL